MHAVALAGIALFVLLVLLAVTRANEVFRVSIRQGRCLIVRGHLPPALMDEFQQVARRSRIERALLRAVRGGGRARLVVSGVDGATAQRLRNVFGVHGSSELRSASVTTERNVGQRLGWEWLAWHLHDREVREHGQR